MRKVCLLAFIALVNLWPAAGESLAQGTEQRRGVTVSSPTGARPVPEELRNTPPQRLPGESGAGAAAASAAPYGDDIPDHVVYPQMFRQVLLMSLTDGRQGVNCYGRPLGPVFRENADLSDRQYKSLLKIAAETTAELDALAQKAVPLIREHRARTPGGRLAPGETPPPAPPELEALNRQRTELVEGAIGKIRTSFGEKDFSRFSDFVDKNFRFRIAKTTVPLPR